MQLEAGSCSWKLRRTEVCEASTDEEPAPHCGHSPPQRSGGCAGPVSTRMGSSLGATVGWRKDDELT